MAELAAALNLLREQIKQDNERSLELLEEKITLKINKNIDDKFKAMQIDIESIKETQNIQEKRLDEFDKKLRQRNLILFGILEEEKCYIELEELILQIINVKMEIPCEKNEIEYIGRMGKKGSKPRPIRVTFTTFGKKIVILQNKKLLEGTGAYIKEDYPPKVLETRKLLIPELNEYRNKGTKAILKYDKLIVIEKPNNKRAHSASPSDKSDLERPNIANKNTNPGQISKKTKTSSPVSKTWTSNIKQNANSSSLTSYLTKGAKNNKINSSDNADTSKEKHKQQSLHNKTLNGEN